MSDTAASVNLLAQNKVCPVERSSVFSKSGQEPLSPRIFANQRDYVPA
jgi:hypothetical protein